MKQEAGATAVQLRTLKAGSKDLSDALGQHKASVKRTLDDMEKRHDAQTKAAAAFSEALRIPNPLAVSMAAAAV